MRACVLGGVQGGGGGWGCGVWGGDDEAKQGESLGGVERGLWEEEYVTAALTGQPLSLPRLHSMSTTSKPSRPCFPPPQDLSSHDPTSPNKELAGLIKEVTALIDLGQHPNVIRFIGICIQPPRIVTEYYKWVLPWGGV